MLLAELLHTMLQQRQQLRRCSQQVLQCREPGQGKQLPLLYTAPLLAARVQPFDTKFKNLVLAHPPIPVAAHNSCWRP